MRPATPIPRCSGVSSGGVPGETTAEGLRRLPAVLAKHRPKLVLLCLGANDTLQGVNPKQTADKLKAMAQMAKAHGAAVVLIGVPARNLFGGVPDYYAEIATALDLAYEGEVMYEVHRDPALKSDPVHANSAGYHRIGERFRFNRRFYPMTDFNSVLGIGPRIETPTYENLYRGEWRHPKLTEVAEVTSS